MGKFVLSVMEGDGIGPEIVKEGLKVLEEVGKRFKHTFEYKFVYVGGCSIDKYGVPLTQETIDTILSTDALFFGSVGGPKWENLPHHLKPEAGLLGIRKALGAFANLRPAKIYDELLGASTLKKDVVEGIDLLVVRELTGGIDRKSVV